MLKNGEICTESALFTLKHGEYAWNFVFREDARLDGVSVQAIHSRTCFIFIPGRD